jgi:hypothetical protein
MSHIATGLRSVVDQDGAAILDIPRNQITTLNATGGFVWERLQQGLPVDKIIRELARESKTNPVIVESDVNAFLEQLKLEHLLRS